MNNYNFVKGMEVIETLNCGGLVSETTYTVLAVTRQGVFLDNGRGNDPIGPFHNGSGLQAEFTPYGTKHIRPL